MFRALFLLLLFLGSGTLCTDDETRAAYHRVLDAYIAAAHAIHNNDLATFQQHYPHVSGPGCKGLLLAKARHYQIPTIIAFIERDLSKPPKQGQ